MASRTRTTTTPSSRFATSFSTICGKPPAPPRRPSGITQKDAFVRPALATVLHEASHALFDLLKIPLLGGAEDAAESLASYHVLQFPKEMKRRLIVGSVDGFTSELKVRSARDLSQAQIGGWDATSRP